MWCNLLKKNYAEWNCFQTSFVGLEMVLRHMKLSFQLFNPSYKHNYLEVKWDAMIKDVFYTY